MNLISTSEPSPCESANTFCSSGASARVNQLIPRSKPKKTFFLTFGVVNVNNEDRVGVDNLLAMEGILLLLLGNKQKIAEQETPAKFSLCLLLAVGHPYRKISFPKESSVRLVELLCSEIENMDKKIALSYYRRRKLTNVLLFVNFLCTVKTLVRLSASLLDSFRSSATILTYVTHINVDLGL